MGSDCTHHFSHLAEDIGGSRHPAIRFLVEAALRQVASDFHGNCPQTRDDWIERLCEALMSEAETSHHAVIAGLMASGVSSEQIFQDYVPEAARRLGEMWVADSASFMDVTIGASRLQGLCREAGEMPGCRMIDRTIALGQSILMVVPDFEHHSLGAFLAAETFRRHGIWTRMSVGLRDQELALLLCESRFSALCLSLATRKSLEMATDLIAFLRSNVPSLPPVIVGVRVVSERGVVAKSCGADIAVKSVREAIERCGLATVAQRLTVPDNT